MTQQETQFSLAAKLWRVMPIAKRMQIIKQYPQVAKVVEKLPPEQTLKFIQGEIPSPGETLRYLEGDNVEYMGFFPLLAAIIPSVIKWGKAAVGGIKKVVGLAKKVNVSKPAALPAPKKGVDPKVLLIGGGAVVALLLLTRK